MKFRFKVKPHDGEIAHTLFGFHERGGGSGAFCEVLLLREVRLQREVLLDDMSVSLILTGVSENQVSRRPDLVHSANICRVWR